MLHIIVSGNHVYKWLNMSQSELYWLNLVEWHLKLMQTHQLSLLAKTLNLWRKTKRLHAFLFFLWHPFRQSPWIRLGKRKMEVSTASPSGCLCHTVVNKLCFYDHFFYFRRFTNVFFHYYLKGRNHLTLSTYCLASQLTVAYARLAFTKEHLSWTQYCGIGKFCEKQNLNNIVSLCFCPSAITLLRNG